MSTPITTQQPFAGGLKEYPVDKEKDLLKIKNWMATQPHLPSISDEYIYLFLHACYYSHDKTKHTIETYFTIRTNTPTLFADRDAQSPRIQTIRNMGNLVRLPKSTPEGYKVLMYTVKHSDYTKFVFADAVKAFCMYNDVVLSEDGLTEGYIVLFDMKGVCLGHLARVSLPALRAFMIYIQEAHPARLKAVHVLNTANFINHIMRLLCPMIKSEILSILHFHSGVHPDSIPLDILPKDYGGDAPTIAELDAETQELTEQYVQWLKDTESFKVDDSKRPKKQSWWNYFTGSSSAPTLTVEQQKEEFLNNLKMD